MIKILVKKNDRFAFCVVLNNRDAKKFLAKFAGSKEYFLKKDDYPNDYILRCTKPEGYSVEVYSDARDTLDKAIDLMDGDI